MNQAFNRRSSRPRASSSFWQRLGAPLFFCGRGVRRGARWLGWLLLIAYFIFCGLFLALRYAVLPNVDRYKPQIEQAATKAIGRPVSIAAINASWHGLWPKLQLKNVVIHDRFGQDALTLPQIGATLSWWSVVVADLRLQNLEILQPDLDIERDVAGKLYVGGMLVDLEKSGDGSGAEWVLSQREIVIRNGRVRWVDQRRGGAELVLTDVNATLHNGWLKHQFALTATPPAAYSQALDVRAWFTHPRFSGKISDPSLWRGELYADLRGTDLAVWKAYVNYPFEVERGNGSLRTWLAFDHAQITGVTADLSLSGVSARLAKELPWLNLLRVDGRVGLQQDAASATVAAVSPYHEIFGGRDHTLSLSNFSFETDDGLKLPPAGITENYTAAKNADPQQFRIAASSIDFGALAKVVLRLPLPAEQRQLLAELAPRGQLENFTAQWRGSLSKPLSYRVKGHFSNLGVNPHRAIPTASTPVVANPMLLRVALPVARDPIDASTVRAATLGNLPGFDNLSGNIDANENGGALTLSSPQLKVELPGILAEPLPPFDKLELKAKWELDNRNLTQVQVERLDVLHEGAQINLRGKHQFNRQQSGGVTEVDGRIHALQLSRLKSYVPLSASEKLREWLGGAFQGGLANDLSIHLKGDLAQFPFRTDNPKDKPTGEFKVTGKLDNVKMNYAPSKFAEDGKSPQWPLIENGSALLTMERSRLEVEAKSATSRGLNLADIKVVIPDLVPLDKVVDIEGNVAGPLQAVVGFVNHTPVADLIARFTEDTNATGNASMALKLHLFLEHIVDSKVQGALQFGGNEIVLLPNLPPFSAGVGKLEFTEKGITLNGIKANFLGGPLTLSGGSQRDGSILVRADGNLTADGVQKAYPTLSMQRMTSHLSGATRYGAWIGVKNHRTELVIESTLRGLGLNFPVPLQKNIGDSLPLKFEMVGLPTADGLLRDEMRLSLGPTIAARYERQKSTDKNASWKVVRGGIGVNVPAPQPDTGLIANVSLKALNIDAWRTVVASITSGKNADEKTTGKRDETPDADALGIGQYITPEILAARANELIVVGKKLDNVVVGASHQEGVWQANLDSAQASGYVTWYEAKSGTGVGKATARLTSLTIPEASATQVGELLEGGDSATQIPGLDVVADNFELLGKKMGRLELLADNVGASLSREWRINKLSLINPDAEFRATGKWQTRDGNNNSSINYVLDIADAGRLLTRFGYDRVLRGGKGKMSGDLAWNGLPFSLDIPTLSGNLNIDLAAGQFLKADPGAAKLLFVLSLQSLPRHLTLDFRDIFSEGFAFDGVAGGAVIERGVARTNNLKMRSANATVLMDGLADIVNETQNMHVVVLPEINVGAASIVYALAINPVIGVGTFLAQLFLREPLRRAFTFEYRVTGPWSDPVINKLNRNQREGAARNADPLPPASGELPVDSGHEHG